MPTFSYAQAAKGASETPVPAKPVSTEPEKTETKPVEQTNNVVTEPVTATSEIETPQETEKATTSVDEDAEFTTVTNKHANRSKAVHSRTSSPSVRSTAAHSKDGESSNTPNGTQEASEKQGSDKAEKAGNDTEEQKEKSGKSEKSEKTEKSEKSEKAEKNTPPKELKAAPLPSVNIWLQRKEAQEAKAKTTPAPTAGKASTGKATEENQQDSPKTNSKKKGTDGPQEGAKGGKKADGVKGRDGALPPVEDASSWPTPEVAIGEDKKKAQEKTDKPEKAEKSPVMRAHGKEKWMPVDYVPTAVFNTPLPSAGRGGRRAPRGGRDGGRGGSHATAAGEKAASGQPAPTSVGKQASGERGRNEAGTGRAVSLPAQTRRSTSSDVTNSEGRKAQAERNNRPQRGTEDAAASNGKQTNGGDNTARSQRDGKQSHRNGDGRNAKGGNLAVESQAAARANDRRFDSGSKSADINREAGANGFQDFRERGDSRAERGGRGANRGRGGAYSGYPGQNGQFGMGNNFASKNFGFNDRQRSQHGVTNGSQQNNRMSLRSPSLTGSANPYGVYPFPSEINTMYPYQAVNPGPMSAVPYQQYMEPYSLMNMLSMQLEYYFSVDNMCKDMFLRSQMDSQGFTPLSVIATFKRVKSLTEDFELLRHVSRQLRNVEFQTGEDGVDRLRPRENWSQWVLAGAAPAQPEKNDENAPINNYVDAALNGSVHSGSHESQQFLSNGTASHNTRTHLSSNAPEFMPSAQNEVATVGAPPDFSYYPLSRSGSGSPFYMATNLDKAFIDEFRSALGLASHKMTPPSSPLGAAAQLAGSSDQVQKQRHSTNFLARQTTKLPHKQTRQKRPSFQWKGKSHSKQKYADVNKSFEMLLHDEVGGPEQQVLDNTNISFAGYQYWLDCLMQEFNLQMYNEFRRQALDDLFTRHTDDGFTQLMKFYRFALTNPFPIPDRILWDLVGLCRDEAFKPRDMIFNLIQTVASDQQSEKFHNSALIRKHFTKAFGNQWKWIGRQLFR